MRASLLLGACAVALAVVTAEKPLLAQTGEQLAARRNLLDQAQDASRAGDHARALDLAQRAAEIRQTASVRLFIAQEERAVGRLAAALGDADQCAIDATHENSRDRDAIVQACHELSTMLHGQVAQVIVHVPDPRPDGLRIVVAGEPLDSALFGAPAVVTPGTIVVEASAPGRRLFRTETAVAAGATANVEVVLPPESLAPASSAPVSVSPRPVASAARVATAAPPTSTASAESASRTSHGFRFTSMRIGGVVAFALGAVATGVGAGLWFDARGAYENCAMSASLCTRSQEPRDEDTAGVALFWAGAGVAVAGVATFLLAGLQHESPAITAWVDPRGGLGLVGRF